MKILHIGKYYPPFSGGIENFMASLLPALAARGAKISALVHRHETVKHANNSGEDINGVRVYRVPSFGQLLYAPISPAFPVWLARAIEREKPDYLHLHLPNTSAFWALLLPKARRIPWIIHWHADVVSSTHDPRLKLAYRLYRPFEQAMLARARHIVVTSPPYLQSSLPLSRWRHKCRIIPLGLEQTPAQGLKAEDRQFAETLWAGANTRFLSIGRLTYYKGHEYLLRAAQQLTDSRIIIVGSGERKSTLEGLAKRLDVNDRLALVGNLTDQQLHAMLASCDCLCLPSIERTEAFGLVLLEAMRLAKPVAVANVPGSGMGWVVQAGKTGWLHQPADLADLVRTLQQVQQQTALRLRYGQAGQQRFKHQFTIDVIADALLSLYGESP